MELRYLSFEIKTSAEQEIVLLFSSGLPAVMLWCLVCSVFKIAHVRLLHPSHGVGDVGVENTTQTPLPFKQSRIPLAVEKSGRVSSGKWERQATMLSVTREGRGTASSW